jgi:hypothetical protein
MDLNNSSSSSSSRQGFPAEQLLNFFQEALGLTADALEIPQHAPKNQTDQLLDGFLEVERRKNFTTILTELLDNEIRAYMGWSTEGDLGNMQFVVHKAKNNRDKWMLKALKLAALIVKLMEINGEKSAKLTRKTDEHFVKKEQLFKEPSKVPQNTFPEEKRLSCGHFPSEHEAGRRVIIRAFGPGELAGEDLFKFLRVALNQPSNSSSPPENSLYNEEAPPKSQDQEKNSSEKKESDDDDSDDEKIPCKVQ